MGKTRAKSKRARERRRAANQAARVEAAAAEERERDLRLRVVHEVARDFLKPIMPRVERIGAFCFWLKSDWVKEIRADRGNEYSMMRETLLSEIKLRLNRGSTRVTCKYYIRPTYATNVME